MRMLRASSAAGASGPSSPLTGVRRVSSREEGSASATAPFLRDNFCVAAKKLVPFTSSPVGVRHRPLTSAPLDAITSPRDGGPTSGRSNRGLLSYNNYRKESNDNNATDNSQGGWYFDELNLDGLVVLVGGQEKGKDEKRDELTERTAPPGSAGDDPGADDLDVSAQPHSSKLNQEQDHAEEETRGGKDAGLSVQGCAGVQGWAFSRRAEDQEKGKKGVEDTAKDSEREEEEAEEEEEQALTGRFARLLQMEKQRKEKVDFYWEEPDDLDRSEGSNLHGRLDLSKCEGTEILSMFGPALPEPAPHASAPQASVQRVPSSASTQVATRINSANFRRAASSPCRRRTIEERVSCSSNSPMETPVQQRKLGRSDHTRVSQSPTRLQRQSQSPISSRRRSQSPTSSQRHSSPSARTSGRKVGAASGTAFADSPASTFTTEDQQVLQQRLLPKPRQTRTNQIRNDSIELNQLQKKLSLVHANGIQVARQHMFNRRHARPAHTGPREGPLMSMFSRTASVPCESTSEYQDTTAWVGDVFAGRDSCDMFQIPDTSRAGLHSQFLRGGLTNIVDTQMSDETDADKRVGQEIMMALVIGDWAGALKLMNAVDGRSEGEKEAVVGFSDDDGNTMMHLACMVPALPTNMPDLDADVGEKWGVKKASVSFAELADQVLREKILTNLFILEDGLVARQNNAGFTPLECCCSPILKEHLRMLVRMRYLHKKDAAEQRWSDTSKTAHSVSKARARFLSLRGSSSVTSEFRASSTTPSSEILTGSRDCVSSAGSRLSEGSSASVSLDQHDREKGAVLLRCVLHNSTGSRLNENFQDVSALDEDNKKSMQFRFMTSGPALGEGFGAASDE